MTSEYRHKILIVDDESSVIEAVGRTLRSLNPDIVSSKSGEEALEHLKTSVAPFSLIVSDQRMPGMQGTELLARCKRISPETVRILMTGYSDMNTIIDAVNNGAVHRYITKPWDLDDFLDTIRQGFSEYERYLNLQRLLATAKEQNQTLNALKLELVKKTKAGNQKVKVLDAEISGLKAMLGAGADTPGYSPDRVVKKIADLAGSSDAGNGLLDLMYTVAAGKLAEAFDDLAMRNGFEMPDTAFRGEG